MRSVLHYQRIGSALTTTSLAPLAERTEPIVSLEGHPSSYPQFGFRRADTADAFMMFALPNYQPSMTGAPVYPDAFWRAGAVGLR
jgi:predicted N-acetyltransferase YhbS